MSDASAYPSELSSALSKHAQLPAESSANVSGEGCMSSSAVMEREFLEMRALILQLAASLDRVGRSKKPAAEEEKLEQLKNGVRILLGKQNNRANLVQMLFSNAYDPAWPQQYDLLLDPPKRS